MKKVLFVVDERCMGGVSILLEDMFNMIDRSKMNIDLLILHNRGDMLNNLPKDINVLYGTEYFNAVDLDIKTVIKTKNIKLIFNKLRLVFDLKSGLIKHRIKHERKKMGLGDYDIEVAFKDGFTALFTIYGNSKVKYHWIQYDYSVKNPNEKYDKLFKTLLPKFDKIISVSDGIKEDFNKIYNLDKKVTVISNLINTDKILEKAKEEAEEHLEKGKINIVCVGRILNYHKGYDRLINVVSKLKEENLASKLSIKIYGDGPDFDDTCNMIKNLKLENIITMCGRVNNPYKYIKGNDLFILPSRYEAFGLVIVEALTLKVPVMVTKNSATSKIVKKEYGYIVENSENGLYEGLKNIILHPEKLKELKRNLKHYKYNNEDIIKKLNKLFK